MAIGDSTNIQARLQGLIPAGWFAKDTAPVRNAVFGGVADALAGSYALIASVRSQTRIATSGGYWLDLTAWDFFGARFLRRRGEVDDAFRPRIVREILRPRATRDAIARAVTDLTGFVPDIIEPWNPTDCGAYDVGTLAYAGDAGPPQRLSGYDAASGCYDIGPLAYVDPTPYVPPSKGVGIWADPTLNNQIFIRVRRGRATFEGVEGVGAYDTGHFAYAGGDPARPRYAGYDTPYGDYDSGPLAYVEPVAPFGNFPGVGAYGPDAAFDVTDAEIFATISATVASGVIAWTAIDPV